MRERLDRKFVPQLTLKSHGGNLDAIIPEQQIEKQGASSGMARKDTVSVRLSRKHYTRLKALSDLTRVDLTDYVDEAADVFLETRAPIYTQRRKAELKSLKGINQLTD